MRCAHRLTAIAVFALSALVGGCDLSVDPNKGWRETLGHMDFINGAAVSLPQTASAGTPFEVSFNTDGNSCVRGGPTVIVGQTADRVVIEPRDLVPTPPPLSCNDIYISFQHRVMVRFDSPGTSTVVIRALGQRTHWDPVDTLTVERTVMIR
jgi:hypothetical protein